MSDAHARQLAAMAHPVRLQILWLLLSDPDWPVALSRLTGRGMDTAAVLEHLRRMTEVGLVDVAPGPAGAPAFSPSHDAVARFGALLPECAVPRTQRAPEDQGALMREVARHLSVTFRGTFSPETVSKYVRESYDLLASRTPAPDHLPVLAARFAADRLGALAQDPATGTDVLFVCVHNAGRSQIAAAALRAVAGDRVRIRTAGSSPASRVDPVVARVLAERGIPVVAEFPKPLTREVVRASDYVITMGCGDACPVYPGRRYLDWDVPDPAGQPEPVVRGVVEDITSRVRAFVASLTR